MSGTPRVDKLERAIGKWMVVYSGDARELERENAALREQLAEARKTSLERDVALVRAGIHAEKYTVRAGQIDPTAIARGIPK